MLHGSLKDYMEGIEYGYYVRNTREYGENSARRGGWLFEDTTDDNYSLLYIDDTIIADLIIKNENRTWARYIPRIEKAVDAVLSHFPELDLDPDEWPLMLEIAQRVKDNLPNIKIVPDGQD